MSILSRGTNLDKKYKTKEEKIAQRNLIIIALSVSFTLASALWRTYKGAHLFSFGSYSLSSFLIIGLVFWALAIFIFSRKINNVIFLGFIYAIFCSLATIVSFSYSFIRLPFRIVEILYFVSVIFLFYTYTKKLTDKRFIKIMLVALGSVFILLFWYIYITSNTEEISAYNSVYFVLFWFPIFLLIEKDYLKFIFSLLLFACVVLSNKRTGMLMFLIALIYFCVKTIILQKDTKRKIIYSFVVIAVIVLALFLFSLLQESYGLDWISRIMAIEDDKGSNRLVIWADVIEALKGQDFVSWIVGNGYRMTREFGGAHNDYLEILYDYGIIGIILFATFIVGLCKIAYKMKKDKYKHYVAMNISLILSLIYAFFGQFFILPQSVLIVSIFWGYLIADYEKHKEGLKLKLQDNKGAKNENNVCI